MSKKNSARAGGSLFSKPTSRRKFIKGAAVGVAAAATVGVLGSCATTAESGLPDKWDKEVDVVVLGTGTVSTATLAAYEGGSEVLVLEKAPVFGGHTAVSGGGAWIPNNKMMAAAGLSDSREEALTYLRRVADGTSNEEIMVSFIDNCNPAIDFLDSIGIGPWALPIYGAGPAGTMYADYYPDSYPGHKSQGRTIGLEAGYGNVLMAAIKDAIDARGIEVMLETPAKRLVYKGNPVVGDGEVVGVIAEDANGQEIAIKARQGVCIGTGGFDRNPEMRKAFLRYPLSATCSAPGATGDGHKMCMAVGAQLGIMTETFGNTGYNVDPVAFSAQADTGSIRGKPGAVVVNRRGERAGNEAKSYEVFSRAFQAYDTGTNEWMNIPLFTLFDSGFTRRYNLPGQSADDKEAGIVPDFITVANSLDELAAALGINAGKLATTIERFNFYARQGLDPDFRRGEDSFDYQTAGDLFFEEGPNNCLAPLETPPYYGASLWPMTMGGSCGGPKTNANAQVLNVWGDVIPRLYVSGNTMANMAGGTYPGGGATIGPGLTFGYVSGKHVATLAPW